MKQDDRRPRGGYQGQSRGGGKNYGGDRRGGYGGQRGQQGLFKEEKDTDLQEQLKDNFEFNRKLENDSENPDKEESKAIDADEDDEESDDDPSAGFFDTIKNSTQVTKEEKEEQRK